MIENGTVGLLTEDDHSSLVRPPIARVIPPVRIGEAPRDELIQSAVRGDSTAVTALLTWTRPNLIRAVRRTLAPDAYATDVAEDVVQDALLRILTALPSCRATSGVQFLAWAFRIGHNLLVDRQREAFGLSTPMRCCLDDVLERELLIQGHVHLLSDQNEDIESTGPASETVVDTEDRDLRRAGTVLDRAEDPAFECTLSLVSDLVGQLAYESALAVTMRLVDEADWEDIAVALNTTCAGAKRRYQRSVERLRAEVLRGLRRLPKDVRNRVRAQIRKWESARRLQLHADANQRRRERETRAWTESRRTSVSTSCPDTIR